MMEKRRGDKWWDNIFMGDLGAWCENVIYVGMKSAWRRDLEV